MKHAGKIALVTGGSRGIGKAISMRLAEDGADIILNYKKDSETAAATAKEIEALGQSSDLGWIDKLSLLIGLGRYPETGNILDILLLSYPLDRWFGFPTSHNLKVLLILIGNGVCGYVLARSLTKSRSVAFAAACVALINPIVFQDINKTGLRQVLLWWLLLYPVVLERAPPVRFVCRGRRGWLATCQISLPSGTRLPWRGCDTARRPCGFASPAFAGFAVSRSDSWGVEIQRTGPGDRTGRAYRQVAARN